MYIFYDAMNWSATSKEGFSGAISFPNEAFNDDISLNMLNYYACQGFQILRRIQFKQDGAISPTPTRIDHK